MSCSNPLGADLLTDYWLAALLEPEEDTVEQHLFTCDDCGTHLREIIALAGAVRDLTRQGSLRMVVSDTFLERAREQGLRIREYAPPAFGSVACTVTAEDDLLIGHLAADLSDANRLDIALCNGEGVEQLRMNDIPFHPEAGAVSLQESITYAKAAPSETLILRLVSVETAGNERLLGEYTFNHTRTLPGPGSR